MSLRTISVALLALVCGISAAVGVSVLRSGDDVPPEETAFVVTAVADVARGSVLEAKSLKLTRYPKQAVPADALGTVDDAVGRTALVPLTNGELISERKLADKNAGRGLAAMVPGGMRAFTIQTPHLAAGGGGFIMPGNKVDVLLTTSSSGADDVTGGGATTTLLQNVQVLAVAQKLDAPNDNRIDPNDLKSVTLLVTPDQAAKLDLGMNKGILHLSLRNPNDTLDAHTMPAMMSDLRFRQEKPNVASDGWARVADLAGRLLGAAPAPVKDAKTAAAPAMAQTPQAAAAPPEAPKFMEIRTLRGADAGTIRVEIPR